MSIRYQMNDHIFVVADYKSPTYHEHLASHIIISLGDKIEWDINGERIEAFGMCIGPNVKHMGKMPKEGILLFLFMEVSKYAMSIKEEYLKGRSYAIIPDELAQKARKLYEEKKDPIELDELVLEACHIREQEILPYEPRVNAVIQYLEEVQTIGPDIFTELSSLACLSKSRLSHLFKEQTKLTLHSYVAFTKLKKTDGYIREGDSITEACMRSGFDSPSHCAATMKRMFGISFHEINKTMES